MDDQQFIWDDDFSVGDDLMDAHHRQFIDIVNNYQKALNEGRAIEVSISILDELIHYSILHFREEEEFMESIDFPDLENHKLQHLNFNQKLLEFRNKIRKDNPEVHEEILEYLKKWWVVHILEKDMRYFDYL